MRGLNRESPEESVREDSAREGLRTSSLNRKLCEVESDATSKS